jgi:acyl-CoA thioesterase FadM
MDQVMRRGEDRLCEAKVTIAFLAKGRPARLPAAMRDKLVALHKS